MGILKLYTIKYYKVHKELTAQGLLYPSVDCNFVTWKRINQSSSHWGEPIHVMNTVTECRNVREIRNIKMIQSSITCDDVWHHNAIHVSTRTVTPPHIWHHPMNNVSFLNIFIVYAGNKYRCEWMTITYVNSSVK